MIGLIVWLAMAAAQGTVSTPAMTDNQIEVRTLMMRIYREKEAKIMKQVALPKAVMIRGESINLFRDELQEAGRCNDAGIHISPYLGEESTRHVLWHEIKHACLHRCEKAHESLDTGWASDMTAEDAAIEITAQCELDVLRDNPELFGCHKITEEK